MKIKQTVKSLALSIFLLSGFVTLALPLSTASAACGGVVTAIVNCDQTGGKDAGIEQTGVWGILLLAINILTAGIGIAAIGGIVYGSVLYTSAGGSQEQVKKALGIITNVVIGVVAYALMFSFLNFLIPGGLFN
jgi:hypothetical protein